MNISKKDAMDMLLLANKLSDADDIINEYFSSHEFTIAKKMQQHFQELVAEIEHHEIDERPWPAYYNPDEDGDIHEPYEATNHSGTDIWGNK